MAQFGETQLMSKKPTSYLDVMQQNKPNLFDFSDVKPTQPIQTPQMNFGQPVSQRNVTNFTDYQSTLPKQQPTTQKSGFSIIPTANASENMFDKYMNDPNISKQGKFKMLSQVQSGEITEDDANEIIAQIYGQTQKQDINQMGLLEEGGQRLSNLGTKLGERVGKFGEAFTKERSQNPFVAGLQNLGAGIGAVGQIAGGIGDIAFEGLAYVTPDIVKETLTGGAKKAWENTPETIKQTAINAIKVGGEEYKQFKQNNPFLADTLEGSLNIASLAPIGYGGKVAGKGIEKTGEVLTKGGKILSKGVEKAGEGVTTTAEYGTKLLTGLNRETQQAIKSNPKLFQSIKKGEITPEQIAGDLKTNIGKRLETLSETGKGYQELKKSNIQFPKTEIQTIYDNRLTQEGLSKNLIELPLEDRNAIKQAQYYLNELPTESLTTKEAIELKAKLRSLVSYDKGVSPEGERVVKGIIKDLDNNLKNKIPGYKELDAVYGPEREFLNKVQKDILNKDGTLKDNAISTIRNLTGKGKENKLGRLEQIMPGISEKVKGIKAYEDLQNAIEGKTGSYARGALLGGGGFIAGGPIGGIITFAITHPSIASKALELYGLSKSKINGLLNKFKTKTPLNTLEQNQIKEAIKTPSSKIFNNLIENDGISTTTNMDNIGGNIQQNTKKIILSPREKALLKPNQPTNVSNKKILKKAK